MTGCMDYVSYLPDAIPIPFKDYVKGWFAYLSLTMITKQRDKVLRFQQDINRAHADSGSASGKPSNFQDSRLIVQGHSKRDPRQNRSFDRNTNSILTSNPDHK